MSIALITKTDFDNNSSVSTISISISSGNAVLLGIANVAGFATVTNVTDDGGNSYSLLIDITNIHEALIWGSIAAHSATVITITFSEPGSFVFAATAATFSGVGSFGNTGSAADNPSTAQTVSVVLTTGGNYIFAVFGSTPDPSPSTIASGTFITNNYHVNQSFCIMSSLDNTSASSGSLATAFNSTVASAWEGAAVELIAGVSVGGPTIIINRQQVPVSGPRRTQIIQM